MRSCLLLIVFLICFAAPPAHAQYDSLLSRITFLKTDFDTNYIRLVPKDWEAHLYMQIKYNSFESSDKGGKQNIYFDPLTNVSLGGGGSYTNFSLDYGFAVTTNRNDSANARGFDFITSLYVGQHIFDFGIRRYNGYYVSGFDSSTNSPFSTFRNDIVTANLFVNYLYNFNYRRFSLNSSFIGTEIQRKSAGAPLAGIFFQYNDLHANSSVVPPELEYPNNKLLPISEANIWSTGLIAGYAYTFVLPMHFYLTLSIVPGITMNAGEVKTDHYFGIGNPITVSYKLISKNAFGFSSSHFYGYMALTSDRSWVRLNKDEQFTNDLGRWIVLLGYLIK